MFNKEMILNYILSYTEDEKIYKTYYELRNNPTAQDDYVKSLDKNFLIKNNVLIPGIPGVIFPEILRESDFDFTLSDSEEKYVLLSKHYRYTPAIEHSHDYFEIIYMLRGTCKQTLGGENLPLRSGDLCFIPPFTKHTLEIFDDSVAINITIRKSKFQEIFLNNMRNDSLLTHFFLSALYSKNPMKRIVFSTGNDVQIEDTILSMYLEFISNDDYSSQVVENMIPILFINIQRKYSRTASVLKDSNTSNLTAIKLIEYINRNDSSTTLNKLADHFHYSIAHCSRLIKQETGMTFTAFLRHIRMLKARTLLLETNNSIAYIGEQLGFVNTETFIRTFQKEYNVSPTKYRKEHQG